LKTESAFEIFYRNRYRRGVLPTVSFGYRFLSEIAGFVSQNFLKLCLEIFRNCVLDFLEFSSNAIFRIACTSLDKDYLFLYFFGRLKSFLG
jgi:hypothetical protein